MTAVNGGIVYTDADSQEVSAAGSTGQLLRSAGAAAPTWTTATFPATAGSAGNLLISDGTNWSSNAVSSDATLASGGALTISNNAVSDAKLRDSSALSVIGRSANSSGDPADIAAGADFNILRRSGTSLGFGSIDLSQSGAVGSSILGYANGGTGQSSYTNGQLLIGNTATGGLSKATLTQGSGITITNGNGSITIAASGGSGLTEKGHVDIACTNDSGVTRGTSSWAAFPACTSGYTCTAYGSVACPTGGNTIGVRFAANAGSTQIKVNNLAVYTGNSGVRTYVGLTDGTNFFAKTANYNTSAWGWSYLGGEVYYASNQSTQDFNLAGAASSGSIIVDNSSSASLLNPIQIFVFGP
jgi:hypothetical protein